MTDDKLTAAHYERVGLPVPDGLRIPDPPTIDPDPVDPNVGKDLRARAAKFLADHPGMYAYYVRFAREMFAACGRLSIAMLTERVRYETTIRGGKPFKISNSYNAYIARRLVADYPEWSDAFRFRPTRS